MRQRILWNHKWAFTKMADSAPVTLPGKWDFVNIPHTWNGIDGQDGGSDYYRGTCWYAKGLSRKDLPEADRYYLEFEGTAATAVLYVNGEKIAAHEGGYSTWRADITDYLKEENVIAVAVDNSPSDSVYPQNADFTFYGGMYRNVSILAVSASHFDLDYLGGSGAQITPVPGEDGSAMVRVQTWIREPAGQLRILIEDAEGNIAAEKTVAAAGEICEEIRLEKAHLWDGIDDPYLYTARLQLLPDVDEISVRFGVRSYRIDPEKGFFLNGRSYPLHGVARHQDRWEKGNALNEADQIEDMDLICEMGANTIRLAHYQHNQFFYDLCDERGMIVWAEIPYISQHMPGGRENTISQLKELITQNYNHPSIVVWGLSNEITMGGITEDLMENHRILNDLAHKMDPTRPTVMAYIGNCDSKEEIAYLPDVISYNLYLGWYEGTTEETGPILDRIHKDHPDQALGLSEYGADCLDWHTGNPRKGDYTEEYQALYHETMIRQIQERPYLWATHVWNMFNFGADQREEGGGKGQNNKGLVTIDRKYKKDSFYAYKAWLSKDPFVHIGGKRYVDRIGEKTLVKVYSNQPAVELFVNGRSVGVNDTDDLFFSFEIPNEGVSELKAVAGSCVDTACIRHVEKENPAYIMKDPGIILNWFDIIADDVHFSLNDTIKDIFTSPEAKDAVYELLASALPDKNDPNPGGMFNLLKTLTVLRLANAQASGRFGTKMILKKEDLLALNEKLNKIRKPDAE